jgi:hypothetical protein
MASPHFQQVPEHWKYPMGPYLQAPPEHGGEWWLVSPFTTPEPWLNQVNSSRQETLPVGFVEIFGPRPTITGYKHTPNPSLMLRAATVVWEQDLKYFKSASMPEWLTPAELADVERVAQHWGLGKPKYYEGRYGWMARFSDSEIKDFESSAWGAVNATHLLVAQYQLRLIDRGTIPEKRHPFVPPHLWPEGGEVSEGV